MKRIIAVFLVILFALSSFAACGRGDAAVSASVSSAPSDSPVPLPATPEKAVAAAATADEARALMSAYQASGDYKSAYLAAKKLIELDPANTQSYEDAITALLGSISGDYQEIQNLIALGIQNAPDGAADFVHWANAQNQTFSFTVPFVSDYQSADEINSVGISPGNLVNQDVLPIDFWRNGLLTTQGDWIYLMLPTEDFYVYKMRLDGTGLTAVGDARGDNLNVIGDWLYYKNLNDADMPYRIRTDGTQKEGPLFNRSEQLAVTRDDYFFNDRSLYRSKTDLSETVTLAPDGCQLMTYYDGWIYYCTSGTHSAFCRVSKDGGQPQKLLDDWMWHYDMMDGWIYYLDKSNQFAVQRMQADGSEQSIVYQSDAIMNSFGLADGKIVVSLCRVNDDRGKPYPTDLIVVDPATGAVTQTLKTFSTSIYTAKDHVFYYDENYVWHTLDLSTGETGVISPTPIQVGTVENTPPEQQGPGVVGNTSANLAVAVDGLGAGLFAQGDGSIYFANPFDGGRLYSSAQNGGDAPKKLLDTSVANISVVGSTIYYSDTKDNYAICSVDIDGKNQKKLSKGRFDDLSYCDDWLYFRSADSIQRSAKEGGESFLLLKGKMRNVYAAGGWVYYIENHEIGGLWRVPADGGEAQPLQTDFPAKIFAIEDGLLYLLVDGGDSVDVLRMNLDGSDQKEIFSLNEKIHAINISSGRPIIVKDGEDGAPFMALILDPNQFGVQMKVNGLTQPAAWCFGPYLYYITDGGFTRLNIDTEEWNIIAK